MLRTETVSGHELGTGRLEWVTRHGTRTSAQTANRMIERVSADLHEKRVTQKAVQLYGCGKRRLRDLPSSFRGNDTGDGLCFQ